MGPSTPTSPEIQEYLTDLSTAAANLAHASTSMATTVANHHDELKSLRDSVQADRTHALIAIGATVITAGLLWCLTVVATDGVGAAATGVEAEATTAATEAEIATAAAAITTDITSSTFPALIADGTEIFSGIGQFTKADAQILAIQALVVATTAGDSTHSGGDQPAPAHPNDAVTEKMAELLRRGIDPNTDCSEIAEDLEEAADGEGNILRVDPAPGKQLDVEEDGQRFSYEYHEVFSDGNYVYDPRLSPNPIPEAEWEKEILGDNPDAKIKVKK